MEETTNDIAWVAVCAAALIFIGLVLACFGTGAHNWYFLALGGVFELAGAGCALLSWRDE